MIWLEGHFLDDYEMFLLKAPEGWDTDAVVREYRSAKELALNAEGKTDHIGSIRGREARGTWVRFSSVGTNLVGEYHDHVKLPDLVRDLGITSFAYEVFFREEFTAGSAVKALQGVDTARDLRECGVKPGEKPITSYGIEAFYPKIAFPLPLLLPYLDEALPFHTLPPDTGVVAHHAVRYLWAYAQDVAEGRDPVAPGSGYAPSNLIVQGEERLAQLVGNDVDGGLGSFMSRFKPGGNLATELLRDDSQLVRLRSLVKAGIDLLVARAVGDTRLDDAGRQLLSSAPRKSPRQQAKLLNLWRDLHFQKNVAQAVADKVRYIGLGVEHVARLVRLKVLPSSVHVYDMRPIADSSDDLKFPELNQADIGNLKTMMARSEKLRVNFAKLGRS